MHIVRIVCPAGCIALLLLVKRVRAESLQQEVPGYLVPLGGIVICLLLAAVAGCFFRYRRLARRMLEQQEEIEQLNQLLKLKILQARLNPHFLFNSLNALQYFIAKDDKRTSLQYIGQFSGFLRKVIAFGDEVFIRLKDESELIAAYLRLEQYRFPGRFEYEVELDEEVEQTGVPPLITHTLLEDALYRGVLNLDQSVTGRIHIRLLGTDEGIRIEVTDNGGNRPQSLRQEQMKGIYDNREDLLGRRIQIFNKQHDRKISRHLESGEEGSRAVLIIT